MYVLSCVLEPIGAESKHSLDLEISKHRGELTEVFVNVVPILINSVSYCLIWIRKSCMLWRAKERAKAYVYLWVCNLRHSYSYLQNIDKMDSQLPFRLLIVFSTFKVLYSFTLQGLLRYSKFSLPCYINLYSKVTSIIQKIYIYKYTCLFVSSFSLSHTLISL